MPEGQDSETLLGPYRVLDLTDEKGVICGKNLAHLGADVIKIEPPGGSPIRNIGPFYKDIPDPEKSLFWFAYNINKRGITLDIERPDGQELFKRLVKTADIVVESFPPGYMARLGLGYDDLSQLKPDIVMTSITPFGQTGPYKDYKDSDLVALAMGGSAYLNGDPDRRPVRYSIEEQSYFHAGAEAAGASAMALYYRNLTGEGQYIDVSIQCCVIWTLMNATPLPKLEGWNFTRAGSGMPMGPTLSRNAVYPCKDGYVNCLVSGGIRNVPLWRNIISWADKEGVDVPQEMKERDWAVWNDGVRIAMLRTDPERATRETAAAEALASKYFMAFTKMEHIEAAVREHMAIGPCFTVEENLASPHHKAREYWVAVEHPELGDTLTYPGAWSRLSEAPLRITRRAPLIGEHNLEVYCDELGLPRQELVALKQAGVI